MIVRCSTADLNRKRQMRNRTIRGTEPEFMKKFISPAPNWSKFSEKGDVSRKVNTISYQVGP